MIVKHGGKSYDTSNGEEQLDRKTLVDPGAGDSATADRWADDGAAPRRPFKPRNRVAREASRVKGMAARLMAVRRFLQIAYVGKVGEPLQTVAAGVPKAGVESSEGAMRRLAAARKEEYYRNAWEHT